MPIELWQLCLKPLHPNDFSTPISKEGVEEEENEAAAAAAAAAAAPAPD